MGGEKDRVQEKSLPSSQGPKARGPSYNRSVVIGKMQASQLLIESRRKAREAFATTEAVSAADGPYALCPWVVRCVVSLTTFHLVGCVLQGKVLSRRTSMNLGRTGSASSALLSLSHGPSPDRLLGKLLSNPPASGAKVRLSLQGVSQLTLGQIRGRHLLGLPAMLLGQKAPWPFLFSLLLFLARPRSPAVLSTETSQPPSLPSALQSRDKASMPTIPEHPSKRRMLGAASSSGSRPSTAPQHDPPLASAVMDQLATKFGLIDHPPSPRRQGQSRRSLDDLTAGAAPAPAATAGSSRRAEEAEVEPRPSTGDSVALASESSLLVALEQAKQELTALRAAPEPGTSRADT